MKPLEEMGKFKTVVVDPPWPVASRIILNHLGQSGFHANNLLDYPTMDVDEIATMALPDVMADDAWLFCWTTRKFLPDTFPILASWGLSYRFTMVWVKGGGPQFPNHPQGNAEFVVVGAKGNPQFESIKAFNVANYWPRGEHSEKPEGFYDLLRRVTPGPRLDIFGRRRIAGFQSWGNEAPEGELLPDHYQQVLLDS